MLKTLFCCVCMTMLLFLAAGCQSERYSQDRAVSRARNFLLEKSKDLDQMQIDYIRFNDPILLKDPIFTAAPKSFSKDSELHQICVAWQIPDTQELVMVYGTSNSKMNHWYPERIIRKNFYKGQKQLFLPLQKARTYAVSNLLEQLTPAELNLIQYTYPEVSVTDFPISADPQVKLTGTARKAAEKKLRNGLQASYVWKKSPADVVVFTGSFTPGFKDWQLLFAGIVPAEEYETHVVKRLRTPENFEVPVSAEEKKLFPESDKKNKEKTEKITPEESAGEAIQKEND